MKLLVAIAMIAAGLQLAASTAYADDCDVAGAVARVETDSGYGTAFHTGDGVWLTAAHVVEHDADGLVDLPHGSGQVIGWSDDYDVAVVSASPVDEAIAFAGFEARDAVKYGSQVEIFGVSDVRNTLIAEGAFIRYAANRSHGSRYLSHAVTARVPDAGPGDSGAPLMSGCVLLGVVSTCVGGVATDRACGTGRVVAASAGSSIGDTMANVIDKIVEEAS